MRSFRAARAAAVFAVLVDGGTAWAQAGKPAPLLSYTRGPGAEGCADEQGLRDLVAAQLGGTDPFAPPGAAPSPGQPGANRMDIAIVRAGDAYRAIIALLGPSGEPLGGREHSGFTCNAVLEDVATTLSVALRPLVLPGPASAPAPAPPSPPARLLPPPVAPAPRSPSPAQSLPLDRPRAQIGATAMLAGGIAPALAVGFGGFVGIRWPSVSIALEGRGDLPASGTTLDGSTVRTSLLAASLVPCFHHAWFLGCGLLTAGRVSASAAPALAPEEQAGAYAGVGARLGMEVPLSERFAGELAGDAVVSVARPTLRFDGERAWGVATLSVLAALRLVASF